MNAEHFDDMLMKLSDPQKKNYLGIGRRDGVLSFSRNMGVERLC